MLVRQLILCTSDICSFTEVKIHKFKNVDSFLGFLVLCHHGHYFSLSENWTWNSSWFDQLTIKTQKYIGGRDVLWRINIMKKYNAHIKCHSSIKSIYCINTISIVCQNALVIILLLLKRNKDKSFNWKIFVTGMTEDYNTVITPGAVLAMGEYSSKKSLSCQSSNFVNPYLTNFVLEH